MLLKYFLVAAVWHCVSLQDHAAKTEPLQVKIGPGAIQVDGKIDDAWKNAVAFRTDKSIAELTTLDESAVARANVRCLWSDDHLHLLAEVTDPLISTRNGNDWAQDSIEIFIDENCKRANAFQPDDSQYRISAMGDVSVGGYGQAEYVKAKVVPMTGGYRVEASIKLHTPVNKAGRKIGFEVQVNNDPGTGQRESVAKWNHDQNESWHSTADYGTLLLAEKIEATESKPSNKTTESQQGDDKNNDRTLTVAALNGTNVVKSDLNRVPTWAADAVFYQIFPERFRNGDPDNDPTRQSLEFPDTVPSNWQVSSWTDQWYRRADWEQAMGDNFYEHGVFSRRYGGDLQGVISKLDYLAELGINTIYFNPVFQARSLHKYDGNSFHHIDPHFGPDPAGDLKLMATETADPKTWKWTAADRLFLDLLTEAHQKNIRVIIDGVFNHTGRDFFAFADIVANQKKSEYTDWYMIESFDNPETEANEFKYAGWWGVQTLPEFADNGAKDDLHPEPKKYVFQATSRWMDPNGDGDTTDGIDGWRLDVANEVPNKFWRDWNAHVRKINPDAYTVAEIWQDAGDYLADCGFSATMNYHGFAFPVKGFLIDGRLSASQFAEMIVDRMNDHDPDVMFALQNLLDSHDTDRVASMIVNSRRDIQYKDAARFDYDVGERVSARASNQYLVEAPSKKDKSILRLVSLFQMTFVGPPMIYYGTEAGMDGADDPDDRMPMVWDDLKYEPRTMGPRGELAQSQEIDFDQQLFDWYQRAVQLRNTSPALRRGSLEIVHTDDDAQLLVFARQLAAEKIVVCLNRGDQAADVDLSPLPMFANAKRMTRLLTTAEQANVSTTSGNADEDNSSFKLSIPGLTGEVWRVIK